MISAFGSSVGVEEIEAVRACIDRQWLGMGPATRQFETDFAARLKLQNFVAVNNGSNALHLAVQILGLPPGSDIVLPSFTWVACAHAIVLAGHRPVFCDVDVETGNVTEATIRAALTPATRAIMVVHYAGKPAPMDDIINIGLPVIEDAAHAVDSSIGGRACGGIGAVGIYSFDPIKNLVMGEGGGLTTTIPGGEERARSLLYCGVRQSGFDAARSGDERWWEHDIVMPFPKMALTDICAAIGLAQLGKLDAMQRRRREIWETYQRELAGLDWLRLPADAAEGERHSYFTYLVRMPNRDRSARLLLDRGIYTTLRFHPLHLTAAYGARGPSAMPLPNSDRLSTEGLNIPLHPRMSDADVGKVIDEIRWLPERW